MRGLEFQDIFTMSRILTKIDITSEVKRLVDLQKSGKQLDASDIGIEFVLTILAKASTKEVEKEVYSFLGDVLGMTAEEVRHCKPQQIVDAFKSADMTEWKDFFMKAVRLATDAQKF